MSASSNGRDVKSENPAHTSLPSPPPSITPLQFWNESLGNEIQVLQSANQRLESLRSRPDSSSFAVREKIEKYEERIAITQPKVEWIRSRIADIDAERKQRYAASRLHATRRHGSKGKKSTYSGKPGMESVSEQLLQGRNANRVRKRTKKDLGSSQQLGLLGEAVAYRTCSRRPNILNGLP